MERDLISVQPAALQEFVERDPQRSGHLTVWPSVSMTQVRFRWEHRWGEDATLIARRLPAGEEMYRGQGRTGTFTSPATPGTTAKYEIILWRRRKWHDVLHRRSYFLNANIESEVWRGHLVVTIPVPKQPVEALIEDGKLGREFLEIARDSHRIKKEIQDITGGDDAAERREIDKKHRVNFYTEEAGRRWMMTSETSRLKFIRTMKREAHARRDRGELTDEEFQDELEAIDKAAQRDASKR